MLIDNEYWVNVTTDIVSGDIFFFNLKEKVWM